jgi:uncharacterized protein YjiS (DUF1127 family)
MTQFKNRILGWCKRQSKIKNTVRELNALTDRDLNDIGISRYDIPRVARERLI